MIVQIKSTPFLQEEKLRKAIGEMEE